MNLILFVIMLITSFIAVRVGAVAFQLTGLEWSLAKFQSLSCFTGTGFTTKEAELIVGHPLRRKIASVLMVLGNAGLVALIATFANSMQPRLIGANSLFGWMWRGLGPLVNLVIIGLFIVLVFRFFTKSEAAKRFTNYLRSRIRESGIVEQVSFEELMVASGGYGVARIEVVPGSVLAGTTLASSSLRDHDVTVLVVRRGTESFPNPPAETAIQTGDKLLCFGQLDRMRQEFHAEQTQESTTTSSSPGSASG